MTTSRRRCYVLTKTDENLKAAFAGESQANRLYLAFAQKAKEEANKQAHWSFDVAAKVEQVHAKLFQKAIDALKKKQELEKVDYYVCGVCGNTVEGAPPENAPIC